MLDSICLGLTKVAMGPAAMQRAVHPTSSLSTPALTSSILTSDGATSDPPPKISMGQQQGVHMTQKYEVAGRLGVSFVDLRSTLFGVK
jgi:hypothetical protein